ncbi:MAG TPA: thioredoxin family protein [Bacteroidota bacterium]|nr:thioredoxin family protein [Bacteroidota bacterium]
MIKINVMAVFLFIILPCARIIAQETDSTKAEKDTSEMFSPFRDPASDVHNAVVEAKRDGKRIILDVGGEWCKWCHYLDRFFKQNKDVADFLHKNFVYVKINYSKENENTKFLSQYPKIPGYPHFFVLESDGTFLYSQGTGELESGQGHDHDKVLAFLKKWAPSH